MRTEFRKMQKNREVEERKERREEKMRGKAGE